MVTHSNRLDTCYVNRSDVVKVVVARFPLPPRPVMTPAHYYGAKVSEVPS